MTTIAMVAPTGTVGVVQSSNNPGTTYQISSSGVVNVNPNDVGVLLSDGFTLLGTSASAAANGLYETMLPLTALRNADGSALAASAAAGKFGYSITLGTLEALVGEVANNNTKTDDALFEYVLPANYIAGQNISVVVNAQIVLGAGTSGASTLAIKAYRTTKDGVQAASIGPVAQSVAAVITATDFTFVITGTTLNPGERLLLELEAVTVESAASAIHTQVNSVRIK